jgi:hypothetical protein
MYTSRFSVASSQFPVKTEDQHASKLGTGN